MPIKAYTYTRGNNQISNDEWPTKKESMNSMQEKAQISHPKAELAPPARGSKK